MSNAFDSIFLRQRKVKNLAEIKFGDKNLKVLRNNEVIILDREDYTKKEWKILMRLFGVKEKYWKGTVTIEIDGIKEIRYQYEKSKIKE